MLKLSRKARVLAVKRSVSLSRLVAEQLERMVGDEERYQIGCRQAIADLSGGYHLGSGTVPAREELHER
jgi:hypothetical protein